MVAHPRIGPLALDRLGPSDLPEVFGWLDRDPVLNVYLMALVLRDALAAPRDEYWAVRREGGIVALLHIGSQSGAVLRSARTRRRCGCSPTMRGRGCPSSPVASRSSARGRPS